MSIMWYSVCVDMPCSMNVFLIWNIYNRCIKETFLSSMLCLFRTVRSVQWLIGWRVWIGWLAGSSKLSWVHTSAVNPQNSQPVHSIPIQPPPPIVLRSAFASFFWSLSNNYVFLFRIPLFVCVWVWVGGWVGGCGCGSTMKDQFHDPSHHEQMLLPQSYISLLYLFEGQCYNGL